MKILIFSTLFLISGTGDSFDVTGYSGGSIIIHADLQWSLNGAKYFCKTDLKSSICTDFINDESGSKNIYQRRFSLHEDTEGKFTVSIRELQTYDAAKYCFGVKNQGSREIELKVKSDCCGGKQVINTYLGNNFTIKCTYTDTFEEHAKLFIKLENGSTVNILNAGKKTQRDRFSISEDRSSGVVIVTISDVREEDRGVYYCGVTVGEGSSHYDSLYTEIQLQVTAPGSSAVVIAVCVCVALLLIGGLAVVIFYVTRKKRQGSTSSSMREFNDSKQVHPVVCNYEKHNREVSSPTDTSDKEIYPTKQPPKDQDPTYTTVSFQNNPPSLTDATVTFSMEEPATLYSTIKHSTRLE